VGVGARAPRDHLTAPRPAHHAGAQAEFRGVPGRHRDHLGQREAEPAPVRVDQAGDDEAAADVEAARAAPGGDVGRHGGDAAVPHGHVERPSTSRAGSMTRPPRSTRS
jgi:hypothetical protein